VFACNAEWPPLHRPGTDRRRARRVRRDRDRGTQDVALQYDRGDGILIALDLPYTADDDGGPAPPITERLVVTVRGVKADELSAIVDPSNAELYDRKQLTGAPLGTIQLVPTDFETVPAGTDLAWNAGTVKIGVALYGAVQESSGPEQERLVDTSMTISLGGASRKAWDEVQLAASPGTYPLAVSAGDKPTATLDVVIVDHATRSRCKRNRRRSPAQYVAVLHREALVAATSSSLSWSFLVDGAGESHGDGSVARNCDYDRDDRAAGSGVRSRSPRAACDVARGAGRQCGPRGRHAPQLRARRRWRPRRDVICGDGGHHLRQDPPRRNSPCHKVYEDAHVLAFLDISPILARPHAR
jgi:hypothetical protein